MMIGTSFVSIGRVSPVTVKIFATGDVINSMGRIAFWQYGTLTTCHQAAINKDRFQITIYE
jgi:hypothetical protein